jgi:hypothetical protein
MAKNIDATNVINVFIDGDKTCFISKSSIQKFKQIVRTSEFNINNVDELSNKFMKPGFKLICYEHTHNLEYKFKIDDIKIDDMKITDTKINNGVINSDKTQKDKLRDKIKELSKIRKNSNYYKPKSSNNTDNTDNITPDVAEIYKEYNKLVKLSKVSIPIPEPKEILENPDQYKSILSMVLSNGSMNKLGKNNPYFRYFTLLANKIGAQKIKINEEDREIIHKDVVEMLDLKQVVGNTISDNDVDTEDELDDIEI